MRSPGCTPPSTIRCWCGAGAVWSYPLPAALAPQLSDAVAAMARMVESQSSFDPARGTREFTLACSDAEQISEVPRIAAATDRKLPKACLRMISVDQLEASVVWPQVRSTSRSRLHTARVLTCPSSDSTRRSGFWLCERTTRTCGDGSRKTVQSLRRIDILLALGGPGIIITWSRSFSRRTASIATSRFRFRALQRPRPSLRTLIGCRMPVAWGPRFFTRSAHHRGMPVPTSVSHPTGMARAPAPDAGAEFFRALILASCEHSPVSAEPSADVDRL